MFSMLNMIFRILHYGRNVSDGIRRALIRDAIEKLREPFNTMLPPSCFTVRMGFSGCSAVSNFHQTQHLVPRQKKLGTSIKLESHFPYVFEHLKYIIPIHF